jgi:hypothetical protein
MTGYLTQTSVNSASSTVASEPFTIPGAVTAGVACLLLFEAYSTSSGASTLSVTSTGSAWTQLGTTAFISGTSSQMNAGLWYLEAQAADIGATVTCHTSVSMFVNVTAVFYFGAALSFIDVSGTGSSSTLSATAPMPSASTVAAGDWALFFASVCNGASGFSSCTMTGGTLREANFGSSSGVAAAGDSNGPVAAGASIGGSGVFFTPNTTGVYATWVVGLTAGPVLGVLPQPGSRNWRRRHRRRCPPAAAAPAPAFEGWGHPL